MIKVQDTISGSERRLPYLLARHGIGLVTTKDEDLTVAKELSDFIVRIKMYD